MADESIAKYRRSFVTTFLAFWIPALILMAAAIFVNPDESRPLYFAMRIASIVLMLGGLFFMVRYKRKERKWRETGEWK